MMPELHPWLDGWILIIGALAAVSCALLGCFMILRRLSMMGDALSHAVLPGIALGFLFTGARGGMPILLSAAAVGLLTTALVHFLHRQASVEPGAAMGVVFTTLFAIGLILIVQTADSVDLDPGCVLYGAIEFAPLATVQLPFLGDGPGIPQPAITLFIITLINLGFVIIFFKELKITSFDIDLAAAQGISPNLMHYALMALIAVTTVACFEIVGSILIIAMLIVPGATASFFTRRLSTLLLVSAFIAIISVILGHFGAIAIPPLIGFPGVGTSTSGGIAVASGLLFALALFFAPREGLFARRYHRFALTLRIVREDILGLFYRWESDEITPRPDSNPEFIRDLPRRLRHSPLLINHSLRRLRREGLITTTINGDILTREGRTRASALIRSHRLWERYLVETLGQPPSTVHPTAENLEHYTTPAMRRDLSENLTQSELDPHGVPIPGPETSPDPPARNHPPHPESNNSA